MHLKTSDEGKKASDSKKIGCNMKGNNKRKDTKSQPKPFDQSRLATIQHQYIIITIIEKFKNRHLISLLNCIVKIVKFRTIHYFRKVS